MLECSLVPVHTTQTTVFSHQQAAFALYFLHFAASSLLVSFFSSWAHSQLPLQNLARDTQSFETSSVSSNLLLSYVIYT